MRVCHTTRQPKSQNLGHDYVKEEETKCLLSSSFSPAFLFLNISGGWATQFWLTPNPEVSLLIQPHREGGGWEEESHTWVLFYFVCVVSSFRISYQLVHRHFHRNGRLARAPDLCIIAYDQVERTEALFSSRPNNYYQLLSCTVQRWCVFLRFKPNKGNRNEKDSRATSVEFELVIVGGTEVRERSRQQKQQQVAR